MRLLIVATALFVCLGGCKPDASSSNASGSVGPVAYPSAGAPADTDPAHAQTGGSSEGQPPANRDSHAALHAHAAQLQQGLPSDFTVVVQPPFVVVGDAPPEHVRASASGTVEWAVTRLKRAYFSKDPDRILTIWLFKDEPSYERHNLDLFGEAPTTPYGYYSSEDDALVMNIATGGGTLVHELVHPFIEANFPDCPAWFNEGLGSLYEQSADRDGHIVGLTNWRLEGLQAAIAQRQLPTFQQLTSTTTSQFYHQDPGTNYAQARYLLHYLQEQGLLHRYYHAFTTSVRSDPTGYAALQQILDEPDMTAFETRWKQYVMALRFP